MTPQIGQIVMYRSRTGNYTMPAMIIATEDTLWAAGVEKGDVPAITRHEKYPQLHPHVHLLCFTTGKQIQYQEFDVPMVSGESEATPGSWWFAGRI